MKKLFFLFLSLLVAVSTSVYCVEFAVAEQDEITYYITSEGEEGDGTQQKPLVGLKKMASVADESCSSVRFCLSAGTYVIDEPISINGANVVEIKGEEGTVFSFVGDGQIILSGTVKFSGIACASYANSAPFCFSEAIGCALENVVFSNIQGDAIYIEKGVTDATIKNCAFCNIGGRCIFIDGVNCDRRDVDANKGIVITENLFSAFCNTTGDAAVSINFAYNTEISHNEFTSSNAGAIRVGAGLGDENTLTYKCKILNNLIYDLNENKDTGIAFGIYLDGMQNDSRVYQNVVYNIGLTDKRGAGILMGKDASYITIERNLVFDCSGYGYRIDSGKDNQINGNVFALNKAGQVYLGENVDLFANGHYQHNVYLSDGAPIYSYMMSFVHFTDYENLFWDVSGDKAITLEMYGYGEQSLTVNSAKRKKLLSAPLVADPIFEDVENRDFTFAENSPCIKVGFTPWDYTTAGKTGGQNYGSGKVWGDKKDGAKVSTDNILYFIIAGVAIVVAAVAVLVIVVKKKKSKNKPKRVVSAKINEQKSIDEMVQEILAQKRAEQVQKELAEQQNNEASISEKSSTGNTVSIN